MTRKELNAMHIQALTEVNYKIRHGQRLDPEQVEYLEAIEGQAVRREDYRLAAYCRNEINKQINGLQETIR